MNWRTRPPITRTQFSFQSRPTNVLDHIRRSCSGVYSPNKLPFHWLTCWHWTSRCVCGCSESFVWQDDAGAVQRIGQVTWERSVESGTCVRVHVCRTSVQQAAVTGRSSRQARRMSVARCRCSACRMSSLEVALSPVLGSQPPIHCLRCNVTPFTVLVVLLSPAVQVSQIDLLRSARYRRIVLLSSEFFTRDSRNCYSAS